MITTLEKVAFYVKMENEEKQESLKSGRKS